MWFLSKRSGEGISERFLRKSVMRRREGRMLVGQQTRLYGREGSFFLWFLFVGVVIYVAFFSAFFLIDTPRVSGTEKVSEEAVRFVLNDEWAGNYLGIVPKNTFFLVRPKRIEERLRREYPLLAVVSVTRTFPNQISVSVAERTRILLWCHGSVSHESEETILRDRCVLVNENGRAEESKRALLADNMPFVLFIIDTSDTPTAIGEKVYDSSYGSFVLALYTVFEEQIGLTLEPESTTVSRFANEARVRTNEGWEVYFGTEIPLESSLNALKLLLEKELPKETRQKLTYIDMRSENRVYYALREGETEDRQVIQDK